MSTPNPLPPAPPEDADLDALLQAVVTGVTGIDGSLVRPRWQSSPPKQPDPTTDWCAIGVTDSDPDASPFHRHDGDPEPGSTTSFRHEEISVLASFYGPHGMANAKLLRDGLGMQQNTESLNAADIVFVSCGRIRTAPDLINQQWIKRFDMPLTFRAKATRVYPIRNIATANIHLFDDTYGVDETIPVPPGS